MGDPTQDPYAQIAKPIEADPYAAIAKSSAAPAETEEPGFLDKDIPLSGSAWNPTLSGIQSIGRGFRGIGRGISQFAQHPIDTATSTVDAISDLPHQIEQVPAAIHDINASPDPLSHYANAAQDTAGEGAAQAVTALATEGAGKGIAKVGPPAVRGLARGANRVLEKAPGTLGATVGGAIGHATGVPMGGEAGAIIGGSVGREVLPKLRIPGEGFGFPNRVTGGPRIAPLYEFHDPGAPLPEHPGVFPGAHLPENPGVFPGASYPEHPGVFPGGRLPEAPPRELLQGNSLLRGPRKISDPAAALGKIPTPGKAGSIAESVAKPDVAPTKIASPNPAKIGDLLNEGLGGKIPEGHIPVKSSAIRSYKYDPASKEFEATTASGTYIHGDVSSEQVASFEKASSKGKAWTDLKNNSTYVGKIVNGERVFAKPPRDLGSASPDDLTPVLQQSLDAANKAKAGRIARPN